MNESPITIQTTINAPMEKVWKYWTKPEHITKWHHATDDWKAPYAENDLKVDGRFSTTLAAKDGSVSFNFEGTYTKINDHEEITFSLDDGRKVSVQFLTSTEGVKVTETFDPEQVHSIEQQREGWQSILNNFKKYVESN